VLFYEDLIARCLVSHKSLSVVDHCLQVWSIGMAIFVTRNIS